MRPEILQEILQEIVRALQLHGASLDYIATVGSLGDTLPDDEVLGLLQTLNDEKENPDEPLNSSGLHLNQL